MIKWLKRFLSRTRRIEISCSYPVGVYKTKNGKAQYVFQYIYKYGYYEIDILHQPSYKCRNSSNHITHRMSSGRRNPLRICIYESHAPTTLKKAIRIASDWAELTQKYIYTGRTIDEQLIWR
jgi:hypothetical protein